MANVLLTKNFPATMNGDTVIGYTDAKVVKQSIVEHNLSSLEDWYYEDPDKNHLGMLELFSNITNYPLPMYMGMIKQNATITVNGINGSFRYDLPVSETYEVVTVEDTSLKYAKPGIDESFFEIVLNAQFKQGDVITYDVINGCQALISTERPPKQEGENWRYWCKLWGRSRAKYFPKDMLRAGIKYWKVTNVLGEFSTQFSSVGGASKAGSMTCEFTLGGHRGVEGETTMYAGIKSLAYADERTQNFIDKAYQKVRQLSEIRGGDASYAIIGSRLGDGSIDMRTARVANTVSLFCLAELSKMEAYELIFMRGGRVKGHNGVLMKNEGLYHQLRRGFVISYARPGGIKREHFLAAADYIFRGRSDMPIENRVMKFKVGAMAYKNIVEIFRDEFFAQLGALAPLMGTERIINNPVTGSNDALELGPVKIKGVTIPGIGKVIVEHEPSLDYVDMVDRSQLVDGMTPITSYSCIMEDLTAPEYSNAFAGIPASSEARIGNINSNVFYVKPDIGSMWWGYEQGRWSSRVSAQEIVSSHPRMSEQFWCHSVSACWVKDTSRFVIIELLPSSL